jgi:hypothetical protein
VTLWKTGIEEAYQLNLFQCASRETGRQICRPYRVSPVLSWFGNDQDELVIMVYIDAPGSAVDYLHFIGDHLGKVLNQ